MRKEFWKRKLKSQKLNSKKVGSCEVLARCSWLSKLGKMDGDDHLFIGVVPQNLPSHISQHMESEVPKWLKEVQEFTRQTLS